MEKFPTGALYSKAQSLCTSFKGIFNFNSGTCFQLKINLHLTHVFSFSLCIDKSFACDHHAKEAQQVKNLPATWEILVQFWVKERISWRREWPLTPVFFPGEFLGQRNLVGYTGLQRARLCQGRERNTFPDLWTPGSGFRLTQQAAAPVYYLGLG